MGRKGLVRSAEFRQGSDRGLTVLGGIRAAAVQAEEVQDESDRDEAVRELLERVPSLAGDGGLFESHTKKLLF